MWRVTFVGQDRENLQRLARELEEGYWTAVCLPEEVSTVLADGPRPDAMVVDATSTSEAAGLASLLQDIRDTGAAPIIVLIGEEQLSAYEPSQAIDDFLVLPVRAAELTARIRQLLRRRIAHLESNNTLCCGALVINLASREVFLAGRPITLAYKEYELLHFLLSNSGTVFSREELLNKVWGYDFYGGARTVDVHIRRLRSKIESPRHSFIETVRNVGYRFRSDSSPAGIANRAGALT
jgi:DNA-binding response OmpR family regulator